MLSPLAQRLRQEERGFTLIELLIVVVILGILATIVVMNVTNALGTSKTKALMTALSTVQASSDQFYANASIYSASTQPTASTASALNNAESDGGTPAKLFFPDYIRTQPDTIGTDYGLIGTLNWGVTDKGIIFTTTNAVGTFGTNTVCVLTQDSVRQATGALSSPASSCSTASGNVALSTIE